jgi:hypothetical protein
MASVGILIKGTSPIKATLTNVRIDNSSTGIEANDNADVVIADSQISYSTQGVAVGPVTVGLPVQAHIERTIIEHSTVHAVAVYSGAVAYISGCQLVSNGFAGVWADIGGTLAYVTDSRIVGNNQGVWQVNSGAIVLSNNVISGNKNGGVRQDDPGFIYTMKNNTVRDNAGNILGGPLTTLTFD